MPDGPMTELIPLQNPVVCLQANLGVPINTPGAPVFYDDSARAVQLLFQAVTTVQVSGGSGPLTVSGVMETGEVLNNEIVYWVMGNGTQAVPLIMSTNPDV